jgi:hypothetical protein
MDWGNALKGGAGGAMAGSVFGPVGTGIGGVLGGLLGGLGGSPTSGYQSQLGAYATMAGGRGAPQAGPAAQAGYSGFRNQQSQLIDQLMAQSRGQGPSLAAQQLMAAQDRGQKQAQSLAAGTMGPNAALSQFQAQTMAGANQAQSAQDAASARIQEIYNAQQLAGLNIQSGRGADEGINQFNAGQKNDMSQANLAAKLQAMGLNDRAVLEALSQAGGMAGQPTTGDQLLAGGSGLLGFYAGQKGNQGGGSGYSSSPNFGNYDYFSGIGGQNGAGQMGYPSQHWGG